MTQNPGQLKKTITSQETAVRPAVHIASGSLQSVLEKIEERVPGANKNREIFFLGRYNKTRGLDHRIPRWRTSIEPTLPSTNGTYPPNIKHLTIHKSKGLEADYVVVNKMTSGGLGFPSAREDDPIISLLLPASDSYKDGEERRLFYVALTRAREEVWLIVPPRECPSEFIEELIKEDIYKDLIVVEDLGIDLEAKCPKCESLMIERVNKKTDKKFLSCSHYPRCSGTYPSCPDCTEGALRRVDGDVKCSNNDCNPGSQVCPQCETGILVERTGPYSTFLGCSEFGYAGCTHRESLNERWQ